jgi:hypothetical protein
MTKTAHSSQFPGHALPEGSSKTMRRAGYALSALAVLFLLMDIAMKLLALPIVLETSVELGYPGTPSMAHALGVILLICTALYIYPRTTILGAVLVLRK